MSDESSVGQAGNAVAKESGHNGMVPEQSSGRFGKPVEIPSLAEDIKGT